MKKELNIKNNTAKFLVFTSEVWENFIDVRVEDENIWLTQKLIAKLFDVSIATINEHLKNIFSEWELEKKWTIRNFLIVQKEWNREVSRGVEHYNLESIISVWYKVNSEKATKFRQWATKILKDFSMKWYVLDDERLKWWKTFWWKRDYEWLMERVRFIRFDERNIYEKIKDLFTTAIDYENSSKKAMEFFQTIQNKFHYAIVWMTSPEILLYRVDSNKPALWMKSSSKNNITLWEAKVWKNYLLEDELKKLYLLCEQFFAFAELQYAYERDLSMDDWIKYLDELLKMNRLEILDWKWKVSRERAEEYVKKQMAEYQEKWWSLEAYIEWAEYLLENR